VRDFRFLRGINEFYCVLGFSVAAGPLKMEPTFSPEITTNIGRLNPRRAKISRVRLSNQHPVNDRTKVSFCEITYTWGSANGSFVDNRMRNLCCQTYRLECSRLSCEVQAGTDVVAS